MLAKMPWWDPRNHADRRPLLALKGRIKTALRAWFEGEGFIEVECGILAVSPGNEAHLHAFATTLTGTDGVHRPLYLHTSPEFAAKKLLAAGEEKIFEFARVFRNREQGRLHAPEFTMLEWYRAGAPYTQVTEDTLALLGRTAEIAGNTSFRYRDAVCDVGQKAERLTVAEAFHRHAGIALLDTLSADGAPDRDRLAAQASNAGISITAKDNWSDIFSKALAARVEPMLGLGRPTLLIDYPRVEAALARAKPEDARLAERFELYVCGWNWPMALAN